MQTTNVDTSFYDYSFKTRTSACCWPPRSPIRSCEAGRVVSQRLIITGVTTNFQTICTPNIVSTIKKQHRLAAGSPPVFVITTNGFNCVFQPTYSYSFGNVITNNISTTTRAQLVTISIGQNVGKAGMLVW